MLHVCIRFCVFRRNIVGKNETNTDNELDKEWVQLIKEAKNLGIAKDDIRNFLSGQQDEKTTIK